MPIERKFLAAPDEFITVKEAAGLLRKSESAIRAWIDAGKVPALKVGGTLYLHRAAIERMIRPIGADLPRPSAN